MIVLPALLLPKKVQAVCLVQDVALLAEEEIELTLEYLWKAMDKIFQGKNIAALLAQLAELVWRNAKLIAEWALGVFLNLLLHQILAQLTNDIVNWIQNGTEPRFLTMGLDDWLGMAVDNAVGNFIDQYLGMGWLCDSFDISIKLAMLKQTKFKEESKCSLSDIVDNIDDFFNDFSKGGWKGWVKLTGGGNNFYEAYLIAQEETNRISEIEKKNQEEEIARGDGFFSPKDCVWFDANDKPIDLKVDSDTGRKYTAGYKDVWGTASLPEKCQPDPSPTAGPFETLGGIEGPCYVKCISHTPGKQISDAVSKTINRFWDTINAQIAGAAAKSGPFAIYVQAILTALVNRAFKEGFGLLFAKNEGIPSGGTGAYSTSTIPTVVDPTENKKDYQAVLLEDEDTNALGEILEELISEKGKNLAVLKAILKKYENEIEPILDKILDPINDCNSGAKSWAESQKKEIENIKKEIKALEEEIEDLNSAKNSISTVIKPAIEEYFKKYNEWEKAYNNSNGTYDPSNFNDPVVKAQAALDEAKKELMKAIQDFLKKINGNYTGTTLTSLEKEKTDTYTNIATIIIPAVRDERGSQSYPTTGTLYGRLEETTTIKSTASQYLNSCLSTY